MNQQKLARYLKYLPIFAIGIITDRFWIKAWDEQSIGMMFFSLFFGSYLCWLYWHWAVGQYTEATIAKTRMQVERLEEITERTVKQTLENTELLKTLGFDSPKSERLTMMETEKEQIIAYLSDKEEGATSEQIAQDVFNEAPPYRQVDQTYALKFFDKLEAMLEEMLKEGKLVSEDVRFYHPEQF